VVRALDLCAWNHITFKDLDLVVCSKGPGSFTGLRVGMSVAKGIAMGASIPWVAVDTLEVYAHPLAFASTPVLSVLDARKDRYYCALFLHGRRISEDIDATRTDITSLTAPHGAVVATGPDAASFGTWLAQHPDGAGAREIITLDPLPHRAYGASLVAIGKRVFETQGPQADNFGPVYIRKSEAEVSLEERTAQSIQTR
jgi:tRNA threonylcarbamoyladenosine biosynthesis protein TsaB